MLSVQIQIVHGLHVRLGEMEIKIVCPQCRNLVTLRKKYEFYTNSCCLMDFLLDVKEDGKGRVGYHYNKRRRKRKVVRINEEP